jgi:Domain of unknown function (DUF1905)
VVTPLTVTARLAAKLSAPRGILRVVEYTFEAELWRSDPRRDDGWTFVSLPASASAEIRDQARDVPRQGFGSIRVSVTLGASTWSTSVFPSRDRGYVLPLKKSVRRKEGLETGDVTTLTVTLPDH